MNTSTYHYLCMKALVYNILCHVRMQSEGNYLGISSGQCNVDCPTLVIAKRGIIREQQDARCAL